MSVRGLVCVGFSLALLSSPTLSSIASAEPDSASRSLETLMARLASMPGLEASFEEERSLSLLAAPLRSRGKLYFVPPALLARHTEEPTPSRLVVEGELLRFSGEQPGSLDLSTQPLVAAFVDAFRLALRGDLASLRERFQLDFVEASAAADDHWVLQLTPRDDALARVLRAVEIRGREATVASVRISEAGGDETRMRFADVDTARVFSEDERARLFRVEPGQD